MDGEEFEDLIDRLRGDMSNWPDAKRHAGKILLTSSRRAQPLIDEAQPLIEQAWTSRAAVAVPAPSYPCGCHGRDAGRNPAAFPAFPLHPRPGYGDQDAVLIRGSSYGRSYLMAGLKTLGFDTPQGVEGSSAFQPHKI